MFRTTAALICVMATASAVTAAEPLRVAIMDFENQATPAADAAVVGGMTPAAVAEKGVFALGTALANDPGYVLIDRRDFLAQMKQLTLTDNDRKTTVKPSFLRAAQAVNADVVIRGDLVSYSPGKKVEFTTQFQTMTLRVALAALDTHDGTVIAMAQGAATRSFRQTEIQQTVVGEDEMFEILQQAVTNAVPALGSKLQTRVAQQNSRQKVKLSVKTGATDPAIVEIDGMMIGTTPLADFELYAGDHAITIGKAGHQDVSKLIMLKSDTSIEVALFRTKLSAEEVKGLLEKARINVVAGSPGVEPVWIINTTESPK